MAGPKALLVAMAILTVVTFAAMDEETDQHKWDASGNSYFAAEAKKTENSLTVRRGMLPQISSRKLMFDDCALYYCDADASCDYLLDLGCSCDPTRFQCHPSGVHKVKCEDFDCDYNSRCDHVPKELTCTCDVDSGECKS